MKARKALPPPGFTLIELMIVIVILGVLMGTILPRLSSSQARSRDLGRVADLNTISQALETYFDDYGKYPGTNGTIECLSNGDTANDAIKEYLKGEKVPIPPSSEQSITVNSINCEGRYMYAPLKHRGMANNGYLLATDVETYQRSNFLLSTLDSATWDANTATEDVDDFQTDMDMLKSKDEVDSTNTIYVVTN